MEKLIQKIFFIGLFFIIFALPDAISAYENTKIGLVVFSDIPVNYEYRSGEAACSFEEDFGYSGFFANLDMIGEVFSPDSKVKFCLEDGKGGQYQSPEFYIPQKLDKKNMLLIFVKEQFEFTQTDWDKRSYETLPEEIIDKVDDCNIFNDTLYGGGYSMATEETRACRKLKLIRGESQDELCEKLTGRENDECYLNSVIIKKDADICQKMNAWNYKTNCLTYASFKMNDLWKKVIFVAIIKILFILGLILIILFLKRIKRYSIKLAIIFAIISFLLISISNANIYGRDITVYHPIGTEGFGESWHAWLYLDSVLWYKIIPKYLISMISTIAYLPTWPLGFISFIGLWFVAFPGVSYICWGIVGFIIGHLIDKYKKSKTNLSLSSSLSPEPELKTENEPSSYFQNDSKETLKKTLPIFIKVIIIFFVLLYILILILRRFM